MSTTVCSNRHAHVTPCAGRLDLDTAAQACLVQSRLAETVAIDDRDLGVGGLSELSIALSELSLRLQSVPSEQRTQLERDARLADLMQETDAVLKLAKTQRYEHMATKVSTRHTAEFNGRFAWVQSKLQGHLGLFSPQTRDFRPLLGLVTDYLSAIQGNELLQDDDDLAFIRIDKYEAPPKHPGQLNATVYQNLQQNTACSCGDVHGKIEGPSHHSSRLQLDPSIQGLSETHLRFSMLFSVAALKSEDAPFGWQSVQILAPRKGESTRGVRFQLPSEILSYWDPSNDQARGGTRDAELTLEPGEFCNFLRSKKGDCLSFEVRDQTAMRYVEPTKLHAPPEWLRAAPNAEPARIYNLGDILEERQLPFRVRPVLAFTIAKAVWQYYNSEWMTNAWTHFDIHFLEEYVSKTDYRLCCRPFLSVKFEDTEIGSLEVRRRKAGDDCARIHQGTLWHAYPIVFSLGVILLEIATGSCIHESRPQSWTVADMNKLFLRCQGMLDTATLQPDCSDERFRTALRSCFNRDLFADAPFRAKHYKKGLKTRLEILYEKIVYPLWRLLEDAGWSESIDDIESLHLHVKAEGETSKSGTESAAQRKSPGLSTGKGMKKQPRDVTEFASMFAPANFG